jgi:ribosomal protein S18 acetylase RimI-like enzyme
MEIRKATTNDIDDLIQLRMQYLTEHFGDISNTQEQICIQLASYFHAHLALDFIAFLAEEDGGPMACAFLVTQEKPANPRFPTGKTGLLLNVYTHVAYRRKGAAGGLLGAVIEEARQLGLSYIELTATEMGQRLYEKAGFINKDSSQEMLLVLK